MTQDNPNPAPQEQDWTDKISDVASEAKEKATEVWENVEDKTHEIVDKIKSGELMDEAKEKLNDITTGAKSLWNSIVDKFDGDEPTP